MLTRQLTRAHHSSPAAFLIPKLPQLADFCQGDQRHLAAHESSPPTIHQDGSLRPGFILSYLMACNKAWGWFGVGCTFLYVSLFRSVLGAAVMGSCPPVVRCIAYGVIGLGDAEVVQQQKNKRQATNTNKFCQACVPVCICQGGFRSIALRGKRNICW
ncbi:hypothetical protein LX36DRAFT_251147 [Colletotrichum falcatum]|nr:hypothetical protein LX36DRAFT_251147 [Colletotrichum falcatum]